MLSLAVSALSFQNQMLRAPVKGSPKVLMQEAEAAPAPLAKSSSVPVLDKKKFGNMAGGALLTDIYVEGFRRLDSNAPYEEGPGDWATSTEPKNQADMIALAQKQNPVLGFWDPLNIISEDVSPETIGWFRHAEIKHGRVAMAAFVGYCLQYNGVVFPWNIQAPIGGGTSTFSAISFADIAAVGGPADQWDALPTLAKVQILLGVGFLEMWGETSVALELDGEKHYVKGGKPGYYPKFADRFPHPMPLNLWDPFGFTKKMTPERKEKALIAEVNNGRLAMIGIFSFIASSKGLVVPGTDTLGLTPYAGEIMAPFTTNDVSLPFVENMMSVVGKLGY